MDVLRFRFLKLELKRHNWRDYIRTDNPAAAALLSKMGYRPEEKVRLKLEFLRMLLRLRLDPARTTLIAGFFDTYLKLDPFEKQQFQSELDRLDREELNAMIELTTSWHEEGWNEGFIHGKQEGKEEGKQEGKLEDRLEEKLAVAENMLRKNLPDTLIADVTGLSLEQITALKDRIGRESN